MKLYELIDNLKQCDLSKEVYIYDDSNIFEIDISNLDELSDRIDINLNKKD